MKIDKGAMNSRTNMAPLKILQFMETQNDDEIQKIW
jgi:hypothetical protein